MQQLMAYRLPSLATSFVRLSNIGYLNPFLNSNRGGFSSILSTCEKINIKCGALYMLIKIEFRDYHKKKSELSKKIRDCCEKVQDSQKFCRDYFKRTTTNKSRSILLQFVWMVCLAQLT